MKHFVRATLSCAVASMFLVAGGAHAQAYPSKPVRVVIGFAPGGPADMIGRLIAPRLTEALGQQVVIENRGGAGGTIGAEQVTKAAPDGYTLGLGSSGNLIVAPNLYPKLGYSVAKDVAPVSCLANTVFEVAVINPRHPARRTMPARSAGELFRRGGRGWLRCAASQSSRATNGG